MEVLVADDDPTSRLLLKRMLPLWGYDAVLATDGMEAWRILQGQAPPQLAILDWMMPHLTGIELCRKVRQMPSLRYMYVILLTSRSDKHDIVLGLGSGADDYLIKPFNTEELHARLDVGRRILERQRAFIRAPGETAGGRAAGRTELRIDIPGLPEESRALVRDLLTDPVLAMMPRVRCSSLVLPAVGGIPLLSKLGDGSAGAVYRGFDLRLKHDVAVKVLASLRDADNTVARFYREAHIASQVQSQHLVKTYEVAEEHGFCYLTMEFIDGMSADTYLKYVREVTGKIVAETTALEICIAACKGLAAAHEHGIIHRDVKPGNILIPRGEEPRRLAFSKAKLADLGLAKDEQTELKLTRTSVAMGTPGFMAPEQIRDTANAGRPADVFAMGATLFCLLSAEMPFGGQNAFDVLDETLRGKPVPLARFRPDVTPETRAAIESCLAKKQAARPSGGQALLELLTACRARL